MNTTLTEAQEKAIANAIEAIKGLMGLAWSETAAISEVLAASTLGTASRIRVIRAVREWVANGRK